ncbi:hypothetical protein [Bradyrhizobium sp. WSM1743]|uniref:hypothetical protein n=1 Tax=Bradyrhizobium sp. WSM1743 TaxID=318996 RepID=UPI000404CD45|nr:hypothetical protein [Bradyrhizobium sp. WSM1743]
MRILKPQPASSSRSHSGIEPVQEPHPYREDQCAASLQPERHGSEFGAGIKHAVQQGWLELHESDTFVRLLAPSKNLLK